jgi:heme exporter protein D
MRWQSWAEFWNMGGYAVYVWGSVGVCVLLMLLEVWQARAARRQVLMQIQAEMTLDALADTSEQSQYSTNDFKQGATP